MFVRFAILSGEFFFSNAFTALNAKNSNSYIFSPYLLQILLFLAIFSVDISTRARSHTNTNTHTHTHTHTHTITQAHTQIHSHTLITTKHTYTYTHTRTHKHARARLPPPPPHTHTHTHTKTHRHTHARTYLTFVLENKSGSNYLKKRMFFFPKRSLKELFSFSFTSEQK